MSEVKFPPVPPEPAHPMVVKLHDDLVAIYTHIRDKYQVGIDQAFDRVSREVGFVVATALPFTFEVRDGRVMGGVTTDGLQGTLFDRELTTALKQLYDDPVPVTVSAGTYRLYLFWFEALRLKLRTDWMEPAHVARHWVERAQFRGEEIAGRPRRAVMWEVMEPVHWFDPGMAIAAEEAVLISVIDEVYPELRLVDRISHYRHGIGRALQMSKFAGTMAGPTPQLPDPTPEPAQPQAKMLAELKELLRRYGY